jgi:5-methylcytosine-specific restriction endonuclease McrA
MAQRQLTKRQLAILRRRVYSANYRARRQYERTEELDLEEILALFAIAPHCYYCSRKLTPSTLSLDHKVPLGTGGSNSISNIVLSCRRDNRYKSALPAERYQAFLAHLQAGGFLELFFSQYRPHAFRRR